MKKTENGDKENGGKEQEEFFPRGTIDFLNRELKAVEKSYLVWLKENCSADFS